MSNKWDKRFQNLAKEASTWSKDPSTKVGSVIVNDRRIVVAMGYNGFAKGVPDWDYLLNDREKKYPRVIHAEVNAVLNANSSVRGCTLYTWPFACCGPCAAIMIQAGIQRVVYPPNTPDRWKKTVTIGLEMMLSAGVKVDWL